MFHYLYLEPFPQCVLVFQQRHYPDVITKVGCHLSWMWNEPKSNNLGIYVRDIFPPHNIFNSPGVLHIII